MNNEVQEVCDCGNPEYGFDCVCDHVRNNPGNIDYSCEFHGLYLASKPICNRCEADKNDSSE